MRQGLFAGLLMLAVVMPWGQPVSAGQGTALVRVTPLGSDPGELCTSDRAMVFEDPTGIRIL